MSNETIFYSSDLSNSKHVGLFDRIINIKFTRRNGETFTIHSDYEPVWNNGIMYFKTCQPKPEIRVKYTQYQGTMINVDIFVTNLNIKESPPPATKEAEVQSSLQLVSADIKQGNTTNQPNDALSSKGNSIVKAEIEMGYRGDFYNWSQYMNDGFKGKEKEAYEAYLNLEGLKAKAGSLSETQILFGKHRRCVVTIEWAVNISNPPDRVTQFHGYVGNTEAGFQPFASLTLDNPTAEGTIARITKEDLHKALDDPYDKIDEVSVTEADKEKSVKGLLLAPKGTTYRNFFNGGNGFTLLEAICFHFVTRRFVKTNLFTKRNENLEIAFLEYLEKMDGPATKSFDAFRKVTEQKVYEKESAYDDTLFVKTDTGDLDFASNVSDEVKEKFKKTIDSLLVEQFVGARYTIKKLPEYRRLYDRYRKTIDDAHREGRYMSWWDAASQAKTEDMRAAERKVPDSFKVQTETASNELTMNDKDPDSLRAYILRLQNGDLTGKDVYIPATFFGNDYILPTENLKSKVILKDTKKKDVKVKKSDKKNAKGFETATTEISLPCFTGLLEVRDAYMFGVSVLCTKKASSKVKKAIPGSFIDIPYLPQAHSQITWICKKFGLLMYKFHNGSFLLYDETEDSREIGRQEFVIRQADRPIRIPAIYDMTLSPVRKMRIPFIGFLDPMTTIEWNSTSTIGSMISFYYQPDKGKNYFLNICNNVDFSTTGDTNVMELSLVDTQWTDETTVPAVITSKEKLENGKHKYTQVIIDITNDYQLDTWRKIYNSFLSVIPFSLLDRWGTKAKEGVEQYTAAYLYFFLAMKYWNPSLFALSTEPANGWSVEDGWKRVDKTANWMYGEERPDKKVNFPAIRYCFEDTTLADNLKRIYMRYPMMPFPETDYNKDMAEADDERVYMYQKGEWSMQRISDVKKYFIVGNS